MQFLKIIVQIIVLYGFYYIGVALQKWLQLPIPGSIIGMLLLFTALLVKAYPIKWIETGAHLLLTYLALLFIPVTVGVMTYFDTFTNRGAALPFIVLLSTLLVMIVAGFTSDLLAKWKEQKL